MIDEKKLIENILYADKWNNQHCPRWVINMIKVQPVFEAVARVEETKVKHECVRDYVQHVISELHAPAKSCTHVMASDVIDKDNTKLSVQDAIRYLDQLFEPPCNYLLGTVDIEDQMKQQMPEWCAKCRTHLKTECWQKYFEMRKEEEGKWEK